jgi:hypothetical protein
MKRCSVYPIRLYTGLEIRGILRISYSRYAEMRDKGVITGTGEGIAGAAMPPKWTDQDLYFALQYIYPKMPSRRRAYLGRRLGLSTGAPVAADDGGLLEVTKVVT